MEHDACWEAWQQRYYLEFYQATQKKGLGKKINDAGYRILNRIDLSDKAVMEIGPGSFPHRRFFTHWPRHFVIADINAEMLEISRNLLHSANVDYAAVRLETDRLPALPFKASTFDIILSFFSLEHLHPLASYVDEMIRCLRPGGLLVGAIPAEGGLAWGVGRYLTTRRWLLKHTNINPDKIICWEHPNFADEILAMLEGKMALIKRQFFPLGLPLLDVNLVIRFIYQKTKTET
jgi:SAM-dependent methyltransferase